MTRNELNDQLVATAIAGNRTALMELLLHQYDAVHRWIALRLPRQLNGIVDVEDVMQQVLALAVRDFSKFRGSTAAEFAGWLQAVADHRLKNVIRAHDRSRRGMRWNGEKGNLAQKPTDFVFTFADGLADCNDTPARGTIKRETITDIQVAVASLPVDQREAIQLHHLNGRSLDSTSQAMNRPPGAVRGLLYRAKQSLRKTLGDSGRWFHTK